MKFWNQDSLGKLALLASVCTGCSVLQQNPFWFPHPGFLSADITPELGSSYFPAFFFELLWAELYQLCVPSLWPLGTIANLTSGKFFCLMCTEFLMGFLMESLRKETVFLLAPYEREEFPCCLGIMGYQKIQWSGGERKGWDINAICIKWEHQHLTELWYSLMGWVQNFMVAHLWRASIRLPMDTSQLAAGPCAHLRPHTHMLSISLQSTL